jgi:hypothetical protein
MERSLAMKSKSELKKVAHSAEMRTKKVCILSRMLALMKILKLISRV